MSITIRKCIFIDASDLFENLQLLWDDFFDSSPPFSWGDNNRTMVIAEDLLEHMDITKDVMDVDLQTQLETLRGRIDALPERGQTYVDLEN